MYVGRVFGPPFLDSMKVNGNNYELKVGVRTARLLKENFDKEIESMKFGMLEFVELVYCSLKGYTDFDGKIEDVEDALDADMSAYVEARDALKAYFEAIAEMAGEAKN